jgi:hypothetical protein
LTKEKRSRKREGRKIAERNIKEVADFLTFEKSKI